MTQNQIAYWTLEETKRSNQARETETNRSNSAREAEEHRKNVASEDIARFRAKNEKEYQDAMATNAAVNTGIKAVGTVADIVNPLG